MFVPVTAARLESAAGRAERSERDFVLNTGIRGFSDGRAMVVAPVRDDDGLPVELTLELAPETDPAAEPEPEPEPEHEPTVLLSATDELANPDTLWE